LRELKIPKWGKEATNFSLRRIHKGEKEFCTGGAKRRERSLLTRKGGKCW